MRKMRLFFTMLAVLVSTAAFAQNQKITGTVSDSVTGDAIPSAVIQVKGSQNTYAMTDENGAFSIVAPANGALIVSCLGYITAEFPVNGNIVMNIALEADKHLLDDAIVVAYGTVSREANTGAVTSIKNDQIASAPATSVEKMLSGKMAGVTITSGSGQPGSTSTIRVRGISSVNAGNEPLWVVDGIPVMAEDFRQTSNTGVGGGSSTTFINPNDIESITILKDAAAASIYGSRAANGVILVTTKSGRAGKAKFTARVKFGAQQLINDGNVRPLTGQELIDYRRVCAINAGYNPDDPTSPYYYPQTLLANGSTNWYKELTRVGSLQEYEINATGGNDKASYYASLAYHRNEGVFYGVDYQRFTARINADYKLNKWLKTGARMSFSYSDSNSGPMGDLYYVNPTVAMWSINPWTPVYNEDGSYNTNIPENSNKNPLQAAAYDTDNDKDYRTIGSLYLEAKPLKQLTIKSNNSVEFVYIDTRSYSSPEANDGVATLYTYWTKDVRLTTSNTITYDDKLGDHSLRVLVGQEAMSDNYDYLGGKSPNVNPMIPFPSTSTAAEDQVYYGLSQQTLLSAFGILDYNYANRYYLQASVRGDGSSLFGSKSKWGVFWSVGASWNINNEKWMKNTSHWLSTMKLRASYGVNGNNNIAPYRAYGTYSTVQYNGTIGMMPSRPENPELSWEKNKTWNVGLDLGFFDERLTFNFDFYNRLTTDMLLSKQVPYTTGFGSNFMNVGSLRNRGAELQIEGVAIRTNDWYWSIGANVSFNRSLVLDLGDSEFLSVADSRANNNDSTPLRIAKGHGLYTFYMRDWAGVNPSNGLPMWYDEDGKITSVVSKARYVYQGSPEPKATGGFNTTLAWKGLSLSAFFEFVAGNTVIFSLNNDVDGYSMTGNCSNLVLNYWKNPGDTGVNPKPVAGQPSQSYKYSTRYLQDGSYMRIKDVTLSYNFPEKWMKACKLQGVRLYVSALNPYTFSHVKAMDPELGPLGYSMGASHSMVKSFVGGLEVSF